MKRYILIAVALFIAFGTCAQTFKKQTYLYAVKATDSLYLDRYFMTRSSDEPKPCVIFLFGGGFVTGERNAPRYIPYFRHLAAKGFDVVSIDYRLGLKNAADNGDFSPQAFMTYLMRSINMAVEDLYDATNYVIENAKRWNVDSKTIIVCGSSAGAISALHSEYNICNKTAMTKKLPENFNYAGVISFAGAIFELNDTLRWNSRPSPIMMFHGDADSNVPYNTLRYDKAGFYGSRYIAKQMRDIKSPYFFYSVENANHKMATQPMSDNLGEIDVFIDKMVLGQEQLLIDTSVTDIKRASTNKNFTLMDYIRSNFTD